MRIKDNINYMAVKLRGNTMNFIPGDLITWNKDLTGTVQLFDVNLARDGFDEDTIVYNDRAVKNNWEYILVKFLKEVNETLEHDWDTFVPVHQIKKYSVHMD